ncbi:hypothetical protein EV421DRAFT_1908584 [Armillaria borealis]|uniref:Uncharacterized protein n=1 Tax=Armillaria borealis TaxID=47425 RepID=A0AA39J4M1_9AGAR|nr:hypothetical protein EV421DRAFT_1908584 [Armillaria borealis]
MGIQRATGSSSKIHLPVPVRTGQNRTVLHSHKAIEKCCQAARVVEKDYLKNLTPEQLSVIENQWTQFAAASELPDNDDDFDSGAWQDISDATRLDEILQGNEVIELSHEGGEFELVRELQERLSTKWRKQQSRRRDFHSRRNHTQQCVDALKNHLNLMTDAYMDWMLNRDENKLPSVEEECQSSEGIWVVDIFRRYHMLNSHVPVDDFICRGMIPCAPK